MGSSEDRQGLAFRTDCPQPRHGAEIDTEPVGRKELRHYADIREAGRIAEAEPGLGPTGQQCLTGLKSVSEPAAAPGIDLPLVLAIFASEILQHAQVLQGVDVAADEARKGAHMGALDRIARQQRRLRERFLKPRILQAMDDTRIVVVQGARQVGKSTLASQVVALRQGRLVTLDDEVTRTAAELDPAGFVRQFPDGLLGIDEVQRCQRSSSL